MSERAKNMARVMLNDNLSPNLSTKTPNKGATSVPVNLNAAYIPSTLGESLFCNTYQDNMNSSKNSADETTTSLLQRTTKPLNLRDGNPLCNLINTSLHMEKQFRFIIRVI